MGISVIIYKEVFMKTCPNVFLNGKGGRTKPPSRGSGIQANSAVPMGRGKGGGVSIKPGVQMGSRGCRALHWLCFPLNTTQSDSAGAEERQRLVTGRSREEVQSQEATNPIGWTYLVQPS